MYEQLITAMIFTTLKHLLIIITAMSTLSLLLRAFGCHSNRKSPKIEKICIPSFFQMVLLKLTKNVRKNQFWQGSFTGIYVDPYYILHCANYFLTF